MSWSFLFYFGFGFLLYLRVLSFISFCVINVISFRIIVCKSCLLQRVESGRTFCPRCGVQLQRSRLGEQLKLDHAVQALVYTAVPGLWHEEQRRRKHFVDHHPLCMYFEKQLFSIKLSSFFHPWMKMCLTFIHSLPS